MSLGLEPVGDTKLVLDRAEQTRYSSAADVSAESFGAYLCLLDTIPRVPDNQH